MKQISMAVVLFALVLAESAFLSAHEVTAGIYGTVQDASGSIVPGATVSMNNLETGRKHQTITDQSGKFAMTLIPIGNYDVTAEGTGFKKNIVKSVTLRVNDDRKIVFTLDVGQLTESVTVEASAVTVNTASGATSAIIEGGEMVKTQGPFTSRVKLM